MDVRKAYNSWAAQYDTNVNRTRDLEAFALRDNLGHLRFGRCLEIGCGTGKNTEWLITRSGEILAVDLSEEMLIRAQAKIGSDKVRFHRADITQPWDFASGRFDLVSFSLVLEHIEALDPVFQKAAECLSPGGYLYVGELHPFKQYTGTKARFDTDEGTQIVTCFNHHVSDFTGAGKKCGLEIVCLKEYFDDGQPTPPRILTILFKKMS